MSNLWSSVSLLALLTISLAAQGAPVAQESVGLREFSPITVMKDSVDPHLFWFMPSLRYVQCEGDSGRQINLNYSTSKLTTTLTIKFCFRIGEAQDQEISHVTELLHEIDPAAVLMKIEVTSLIVESLPNEIGGYDFDAKIMRYGMQNLRLTLTTKDSLSAEKWKSLGIARQRDAFSTMRKLFVDSEDVSVSAIELRCLADGVTYKDPLNESAGFVAVSIGAFCNGEIHGAPKSIEVKVTQ